MLKTDDDGLPLCPSCGKALNSASITEAGGTNVEYDHCDMSARAFTTPCVVRKASHAEALAALDELPAEWVDPRAALTVMPGIH